MNPRPAIIGITESWFNRKFTNSELSINKNYNVFRNDRTSRGGGVCLLIHNDLKPRLRSDLMPSTCETVWVNCKIDETSLMICCYYRPPPRIEVQILSPS